MIFTHKVREKEDRISFSFQMVNMDRTAGVNREEKWAKMRLRAHCVVAGSTTWCLFFGWKVVPKQHRLYAMEQNICLGDKM